MTQLPCWQFTWVSSDNNKLERLIMILPSSLFFLQMCADFLTCQGRLISWITPCLICATKARHVYMQLLLLGSIQGQHFVVSHHILFDGLSAYIDSVSTSMCPVGASLPNVFPLHGHCIGDDLTCINNFLRVLLFAGVRNNNSAAN